MKGFRYGKEDLLHINIRKRTSLIENGIYFFGQSLSLLSGHCPFSLQITLITHYRHNDLLLGEIFDITEPSGQVVEGGPVINAVCLNYRMSTRMTAYAPW